MGASGRPVGRIRVRLRVRLRPLLFMVTAVTWLLASDQTPVAEANADANRLYEDIMMTYNRIVLPVQNNTDLVRVRVSLKLSQLIDVNLKNQMMTTNVWLNQEWYDYKLKWDPSEYGGIEDINLPAEQIWLPDIVLYNSAEGYFAVSIMTKAKVRYDGHVTWNPPAIFRSSCQIDITYFPFDSQNCHLKFGSWTFGNKIDLKHINETTETIEHGSDLSEYYQNVEWDVMMASARTNVRTYECCPNDFYPDVTFYFTLRRKPLFYTVNLILPCIAITILSILVFYLPSDSGEKVTLTISILVSLIFFLSVLIETIPSTSLAMPLLGKYLVFTMILITVSVCATVCVLNIHFRTPSTHSMPVWVKRWCIHILPKYLFMSVPQHQSQQANNVTVLPEQLIYLHNQAYVSGGAALPVQRDQDTKPADRSSAGSAPTVANSGLADQQRHHQQPLNRGGSSSSSATNAKIQQQQAAAGKGAAKPVNSVLADQLKQYQQLAASNALSPSDISRLHDAQQRSTIVNNQLILSPSSLFLPFLQSEAARRLQLQRSRSSDRDNRSTSDNQQAPETASDQPGKLHDSRHVNHCDSTRQAKDTLSVPATNATSRTRPKQTQKAASFWARFGKKSRRTGEDKAHRAASGDPQAGTRQPEGNGQENDAPPSRQHQRPPVWPAHESSTSTIDYDYQHHRHFQARASICSTNVWRIGPTRRCSMAVPTSYPTFYRPNLNLAAMPVNSIKQHHHHSHNGNQSASDGETLLSTTRPKQHSAGVAALARAAASQLTVQAHQSSSFSSRVAGNQMTGFHTGSLVVNQRHLDNRAPPPPPPAPDLLLNPQRLIQQQISLDHSQQADLWETNESNDKSRHLPLLNDRTSTSVNCPNWPPPPPPTQSSPPMDYHQQATMTLEPRRCIMQTQDRYRYLYDECAPEAMSHRFRLAPMSRSSSADHRLSQYALMDRSHLYLSPESQQSISINTGARLERTSVGGCSSLSRRQQLVAPVSIDFNGQLDSTCSPDVHLAHGSHSIGRALGQAYMQRLQRQSTMSALHPVGGPFSSSNSLGMLVGPAGATQRPSRSMHRSNFIRNPLDSTSNEGVFKSARVGSSSIGGPLNLAAPIPAQDSLRNVQGEAMRRSRSQTSLANNRRSQFACASNGYCRQCIGDEAEGTGFGNRSNCAQCIHQRSCRRHCQPPERCGFGLVTSWQNEAPKQCNLSTCNNESSTVRRQQNLPSCDGGATSQTTAKCCARAYHGASLSCGTGSGDCSAVGNPNWPQRLPPPLTSLGLMKLISEVDKAIQNAMFIAQHIDNLDEFESVKENWKFIAMVIDRIFLIVFLFACILGTVTIFAMVPWSYYTIEKPIDLQLTRLLALNLTGDEPYSRSCRD